MQLSFTNMNILVASCVFMHQKCFKRFLQHFLSSIGVGDSTLYQNSHSFRSFETKFKKNYYIILTIKIYSTTYDLNNKSGK